MWGRGACLGFACAECLDSHLLVHCNVTSRNLLFQPHEVGIFSCFSSPTLPKEQRSWGRHLFFTPPLSPQLSQG